MNENQRPGYTVNIVMADVLSPIFDFQQFIYI